MQQQEWLINFLYLCNQIWKWKDDISDLWLRTSGYVIFPTSGSKVSQNSTLANLNMLSQSWFLVDLEFKKEFNPEVDGESLVDKVIELTTQHLKVPHHLQILLMFVWSFRVIILPQQSLRDLDDWPPTLCSDFGASADLGKVLEFGMVQCMYKFLVPKNRNKAPCLITSKDISTLPKTFVLGFSNYDPADKHLCVFQVRFDIEPDDDCWVELDSSNDTKFSRHLILHSENFCFRSNLHLGAFVQEMLSQELGNDKTQNSSFLLAKVDPFFLYAQVTKLTLLMRSKNVQVFCS